MAKIKKTNSTKCRQSCGWKEILHYANEMVNWYYHFGKVWQDPLKLNIQYFISSHTVDWNMSTCLPNKQVREGSKDIIWNSSNLEKVQLFIIVRLNKWCKRILKNSDIKLLPHTQHRWTSFIMWVNIEKQYHVYYVWFQFTYSSKIREI